MPSTQEIVYWMKESNVYNVGSEDTYIRRASTIRAWIKWIVNLATSE